jgi:transcriptional antiterminator RfaH
MREPLSNTLVDPSGTGPDADSCAWYLVYTKPRQEHIALDNLSRQGYPCYLPRMRVEKLRRGRAELVTEPMFARYLFVRLDSSGQGPSWAPIQSTLGVSRLVRFGTQPARIDDELVHWLQSREATLPTETRFQPGDVVTVTTGPFAGLDAVYQTADAERRALILLELLSRPVTLRVDSALLRKRG